MKYRVVVGDSMQLLERYVNEFIESGWQPQGGVCVAVRDETRMSPIAPYNAMLVDASLYFQAMVRQ